LRSIRFFLIASILATLILFNFVAALQGYQSSMEEADILFDNQMLGLARLVSNVDVANANTGALRIGNDLSFQIWNGSQLLAASANAPDQPLQNFSPGFGYTNFDGYRWRTFTHFETPLDRWVIIAERTDLRFVLAENVVLQSIQPLLLGIPLVTLLIWVIVNHGLRPLRQLSTELKNKEANDLSSLLSAGFHVELDQVFESINGFIQRLNRVMEREKRFSSDAAHELRTPISALKIQLYNLSEEVVTSHESFQQLQQGVDRMQHLIEQLLALYRATPEQFASSCRALDLYEISQNQVAGMYSLVEKKKQNIELMGESVEIEADQFSLETLLSNLLGNASKYTPEGGSILVALDDLGDEICLRVEDSGPGIPDSAKSRVFDRFYRVDSKDNILQSPGCGLGLAIVTHVAELHQARVELHDSSFETGSSFCVYFMKKT
jgi:two-component system sensor histidine kinase QseC